MRIVSTLTIFLGLLSVLLSTPAVAVKKEYRSPSTVEGTTTVSLAEARALYDKGVKFIDVRNSRFFASAHIPGAIHLDLKYNFDEEKLKRVARSDEPIVIYCSGEMCSRSYRASASAVSWGYEHVYYFRTGFAAWKAAGFPIRSEDDDGTSGRVTGDN